jgi:hypothetical protein
VTREINPGDRIRIIAMPDDPDPIPAGSEGVVVDVTEGPLAQVEVRWDCGRSLYLLPGVDRFELVSRKA